jgi:hypothetical protein
MTNRAGARNRSYGLRFSANSEHQKRLYKSGGLRSPPRFALIAEVEWYQFCSGRSGFSPLWDCPFVTVRRKRSIVLTLANSNTAFDNVGEDATGYNLGMGLAVSWITPLVVGALIDRNAIATKDLRSNLNWIFAETRKALILLHG